MTHKDEPLSVDQGTTLLKYDYVLIPMKMFYVSKIILTNKGIIMNIPKG